MRSTPCIVNAFQRKLLKTEVMNISMRNMTNFTGEDCPFCHGIISEGGKSGINSVNYKENDVFQLENEEISCDNVCVDYSIIRHFYDERNEIDLKLLQHV